MTIKKKYQVFVSSTFRDLPEERQAVFQTLLKMDCIPAGMEFFGANDEEQMAYIRKVIEASDYYLVIVGGRYGSITGEGISYTEKEFDCALELKIPVIALLHKNPDSIPKGKSEPHPDLQQKLQAFKGRLEDKRLADYWETTDGLRAATALAMVNAKENRPMPGWVRGDTVASDESLTENLALRKQVAELQAKVRTLESTPTYTGLAGLDESVTISGSFRAMGTNREWTCVAKWREIALHVIGQTLSAQWAHGVRSVLTKALINKSRTRYLDEANTYDISQEEFERIGAQLRAYGLIAISAQSAGMAWQATKAGEQLFYDSRVTKAEPKS